MSGPTATQIHDHEFEPQGEWWSLCKHCRLGRASHTLGPPAPPLEPPKQPPTAEGREPEPEEELPIGTGTEINMLDAQMYLTTEQEEEES